jgi:DNA-binding transcriptional ArsR family regulator
MDTQKVTDPAALKALAHPLRMRILGRLRREGPATASGLAEHLGESSGATSYHLRQLERWGFVVDAAELGTGRDRWWRASAQMTSWDAEEMGDAGRAASDWIVRRQTHTAVAHVDAYLESQETLSASWRSSADVSDYALEMSPAQLRAMRDEVHAVIGRYADASPGRGARTVFISFVAVPEAAES